MKKIAFDMDGVLCKFKSNLILMAKENIIKKGDDLSNAVFFSNTTSKKYDMSDINEHIRAEFKKLIRDPKIINDLEYYPCVNSLLLNLMKRFKIYIITAREKVTEESTFESIKNNITDKIGTKLSLDPSDELDNNTIQLVLTKNKIDYCIDHGIKILVEDRAETVIEGVDKGMTCFLVSNNDTPYNHFVKEHNFYNSSSIFTISCVCKIECVDSYA